MEFPIDKDSELSTSWGKNFQYSIFPLFTFVRPVMNEFHKILIVVHIKCPLNLILSQTSVGLFCNVSRFRFSNSNSKIRHRSNFERRYCLEVRICEKWVNGWREVNLRYRIRSPLVVRRSLKSLSAKDLKDPRIPGVAPTRTMLQSSNDTERISSILSL